MPSNRLALAICIGSQKDVLRASCSRLEFFDHVSLLGDRHVLRLETGVDVDAYRALREITYMANGRLYLIVGTKEVLKGFDLGWRFDDDEGLWHSVSFVRHGGGPGACAILPLADSFVKANQTPDSRQVYA